MTLNDVLINDYMEAYHFMFNQICLRITVTHQDSLVKQCFKLSKYNGVPASHQ